MLSRRKPLYAGGLRPRPTKAIARRPLVQYGRWTPRPGEQDSRKASDRREWDRQNGRPTPYCVRYADDFVILVEGSREDAAIEKQRLSLFLQEQMHLELSQGRP